MDYTAKVNTPGKGKRHEEPRKSAFMNWDQARAKLTGCFIAVPTLFRDGDLELNLPGMRRHVRFLLEGGVRTGNGVLLVCGGAGDFPTLRPDERIQVAEAILDEVGGEVGV